MSKFRTSIIAVTLATMFFIPVSAIPKTPGINIEEKPPVSENSVSVPEKDFSEDKLIDYYPDDDIYKAFDMAIKEASVTDEELNTLTFEDFLVDENED